jgi:aspartate kinase
MSVVVIKFGGTSLATPVLIRRAAQKVARYRKKHDVITVVSAMAHTTDELFAMSKRISPSPKARELDMLLTAGERISVALFSMALERLNLEAVSFTGSQVGIITDTTHTDARILEIKGDRLKQALAAHKIPVVCGFQGVSLEKEITTLGRGGSDTTAVALGAALGAERCIIFTDVDGVFTEDPHRYPGAKKIGSLSYGEMLELSCRGTQVLHPRASSIAARYCIPIEIRNSFNNRAGTIITAVEGMEHPKPRAMTHCEDLYLVTLVQVLKRPQYLSQILTEIAEAGIHLKFFFHGVSDEKRFDLSFITPLDERTAVKKILRGIMKKLRIRQVKESTDICSLSIIGRGIGSESTVLTQTFAALSHARIHIEAVTTSELSINIFLKRTYLDRAVKVLLKKFRLSRK